MLSSLHDMSQSELEADLENSIGSVLEKPALRVVGFQELIDMELPPREDILTPWLPTQGLAMIYAPRGIGKTYVALEIAYAVASGGKFLHWKAPKSRAVLYLDGEMPAPVMQERLRVMERSYTNKPVSAFNIVTPDLQKGGMLDLSKLQDQRAVESYVSQAELIIVDNISTLCRYGKENEAEGWLPIQDWALYMRAAGKSVLFIHHAGKGGQQRGTSKREDALDTVIALKRPDGYKTADGAVFEVHFEKARHIYGEATASFTAKLLQDEMGRNKWEYHAATPTTHEQIITLSKQGYSQKDIAEIVGIHKSNACRHIQQARVEGLL